MADPFANLGSVEMKNNDNQISFDTEQSDSRDSNAAANMDLNNLNTLDEPVSDTIKRDLMRIYSKLKIVVNPLQLGLKGQQDNIEEKRKEVRNWDLWGPFVFCLLLSV